MIECNPNRGGCLLRNCWKVLLRKGRLSTSIPYSYDGMLFVRILGYQARRLRAFGMEKLHKPVILGSSGIFNMSYGPYPPGINYDGASSIRTIESTVVNKILVRLFLGKPL
jgi:hypothetical protein